MALDLKIAHTIESSDGSKDVAYRTYRGEEVEVEMPASQYGIERSATITVYRRSESLGKESVKVAKGRSEKTELLKKLSDKAKERGDVVAKEQKTKL